MSKKPEAEIPEARATITVSESVTLTAPNRRSPSLVYGGSVTADPMSLEDVEEFVRIARRELRPELISITVGSHQIVARHTIQAL